MSNLLKAAVAIDKATREEIYRKYSLVPLWLANLEDTEHHRVITTEDTEYHIFMWCWEKIDEDKYNVLKKILENRRHAIVEISEDGNIWTDVATSDQFGCDEEFEFILSWSADICLWDSEESVFDADDDPDHTLEWIEDDYGFFRCPVCGFEHDEPEQKTPFYPMCGVKLIETVDKSGRKEIM